MLGCLTKRDDIDTSTVRREFRSSQAAAMMGSDAVKMHHKFCVWESCPQPPLYSWSGEDSPRFCETHASPGMVQPSTVSVWSGQQQKKRTPAGLYAARLSDEGPS